MSVPEAVKPGAVNNKSNEVTVTPSATPGTGRTFDISATIDGKSLGRRRTTTRHTIQVVVTVNPAFTAPATNLDVIVVNQPNTKDADVDVRPWRHHPFREH